LELFPIKAGSATKPVPGYNVKILDSSTGKELGPNEQGIITVKLPLPPGNLPTLWQNDRKFQEAYTSAYPGYYFTGDGGYFDKDGYIYIMGRVDDVINVAGHRLSTGAMEEVVAQHPDVAECAVIGVEDQLKGQVPIAFFVTKSGVNRDGDEISAELVKMMRDQIGPLACFKKAVAVARLPKTRSGKILRATMRKIADGQKYTAPATIEDPTSLDVVTEAARKIGYAK
jgi:propionyl-CoA synthetase